MKGLISIGTLSKYTGVGVKALKYYERLGILKPDHVSIKSGYRYYAPQQMMTIYMITYALELGIPLAKFKEFIINNKLVDNKRFLTHAIENTELKIQNLQNELKLLKNTYDEIDKFTSPVKEITKRNFPERYFLTLEYPKHAKVINISDSFKCFTTLHKQAKEYGINTIYFEGFMFPKNYDRVCKAVIEIPYLIEDIKNIVAVPAGEFQCEITTDIVNEPTVCIYTQSDYSYLLVKRIFSFLHSAQNVKYEIQKL